MLTALVLVGTVGTAWFVLRAVGRGKPYPVWLSGFLDNPVTEGLSQTTTLIERAGVAEGMHVLDAGSGSGRLTIPLARRVGVGSRVIALDLREGMLERVRRRAAEEGLNNIRTLHSALGTNAEAPELQSAEFDRVLLVTVLGEIPDPEGGMRRLYAVLKPGGVLSVTELIIDPDYQRRNRVRALGERAGFEIERSYGTSLAFTQNFRKPA